MAATDIQAVNLVKLAAVTHQFDQGQLFVPLSLQGGPLVYTVQGPTSTELHRAEAIAPPGYYMLFAVTSSGAVSEGQYVRLGAPSLLLGASLATESTPASIRASGTTAPNSCGTETLEGDIISCQ
jgi:hypothetical protein